MTGTEGRTWDMRSSRCTVDTFRDCSVSFVASDVVLFLLLHTTWADFIVKLLGN